MNNQKETIGSAFQRWTKYSISSEESNYYSSKEVKTYSVKATIPIPDLDYEAILSKSLGSALQNRRSIRKFLDENITLEAFYALLWAAQGVIQKIRQFYLRTAPSAGALHPLNFYLFINHVEGLERGLYRLTRDCRELEKLSDEDLGPDLIESMLGQKFTGDAAVTFAMTAVIDRCASKYRQRAYRYIYMDAGHACQNIYLAATALGLGCCSVGAFFDPEIDALLGVDGASEFTIYLASVGRTPNG